MHACCCSLPYEKCCGAPTQAVQVGTSTFTPTPLTEEDIRRVLREELKKAGLVS